MIKYFPIDRIDKWFYKQCELVQAGKAMNCFPNSIKYWSQLDLVTDDLKKIIKEAEKGALLEEFKSSGKLLYLNDHGIDHIEEVLKKVTELLNVGEIELNLYETYLLIFSIFLHDSGNIHGREKHEEKCKKVMEYLGKKAGDDNFEKRYILSIASAHGGVIPGTLDKDKIRKLSDDKKIKDTVVRYKLLAALLRLGDELADSRGRESAYQIAQGGLGESEVFHYYSNALVTVSPLKNEITLIFELSKENITRKYKKGEDDVYLIDEIKKRTLKMFQECIYCMRFLRPYLNITIIKCQIDIFNNFTELEGITEPIKKLGYNLIENGYPDLSEESINVSNLEFGKIDGENLKNEMI